MSEIYVLDTNPEEIKKVLQLERDNRIPSHKTDRLAEWDALQEIILQAILSHVKKIDVDEMVRALIDYFQERHQELVQLKIRTLREDGTDTEWIEISQQREQAIKDSIEFLQEKFSSTKEEQSHE
jgi:hypothetical protein